MIKTVIVLMVALMTSGFMEALFAQSQETVSLIEVAKRSGGKATLIVAQEIPPTPLPALVDMSVLIVRGRIVRAAAHLSDDESTVFTDYVVVPLEILKRPEDLGTSTKPGATSGIVVRRLGGTVTVGDLTLRTRPSSEAWEVPVTIGDEYLLFLNRESHAKTQVRASTTMFHLTNGPLSIFAVQEGRLKAMALKGENATLATDRTDVVLAQVRDMVAKKSKK